MASGMLPLGDVALSLGTPVRVFLRGQLARLQPETPVASCRCPAPAAQAPVWQRAVRRQGRVLQRVVASAALGREAPQPVQLPDKHAPQLAQLAAAASGSSLWPPDPAWPGHRRPAPTPAGAGQAPGVGPAGSALSQRGRSASGNAAGRPPPPPPAAVWGAAGKAVGRPRRGVGQRGRTVGRQGGCSWTYLPPHCSPRGGPQADRARPAATRRTTARSTVAQPAAMGRARAARASAAKCG